MNTSDAAYHVAHDHPGGVVALAARMGKSKHVLSNKLNPNQTRHHLTLGEAEHISHLTGDGRIVDAFAQSMGMVCLPMDIDYSGTSDMELLDTYAEMMARIGHLSQTLRDALADGQIDSTEMSLINHQVHDLRTAEQELLNRIASLCVEDEDVEHG